MAYSEHVGTNLQLFGRRGDKLYLYSLISAIKSFFIRIKPGNYFDYARLQISECSFCGSIPCNNNKVVVKRLVFQQFSEYFPETAFHSIPHNGVSDFSAYGKAKSAARKFVR